MPSPLHSVSAPALSQVTVALIGAGPFADAYAPLLQLFEAEVEVKYVWSRTLESARAVIDTKEPVMQDAKPMEGKAGFQAILCDPSLEAVVLVLPPNIALQYVLRALAAGKSVLSEKPVASSVADARAAVEAYAKMRACFRAPPVWFVAENFRFEEVFVEAARLVPRLGFLLRLDLRADTPLNARYYVSAWSRNQTPGGFMIDMSVHHMAALRMVAEAAGAGMPTSVKAQTHNTQSGLAPPDGAEATVTWESGLVSSVALCMVAASLQYKLSITGLYGNLEITRKDWDQYKLKYKLRGDRRSTTRLFRVAGVQNEFRSFLGLVRAWKDGRAPAKPAQRIPPKPRNRFDVVRQDTVPEWRGRPEEGYCDLALVAAIIESGDMGRVVDVPTLHAARASEAPAEGDKAEGTARERQADAVAAS
eukprot:jgi/Ulvmu1/6908/UM031_0115.1